MNHRPPATDIFKQALQKRPSEKLVVCKYSHECFESINYIEIFFFLLQKTFPNARRFTYIIGDILYKI